MTNPFDKISKKNKEKLLKLLKTHNIYYKKNEKLLKDTDDISIVITGYLHVIRNNYNGTQNIVEEYDENDIIGSNSSYINNPEYEIICKEDTTLLIFNYNELINIETNDKTYNQFIKNLFIIMNEKMLTKNERIDILTKKTIRNKLLEYFSIMSKKMDQDIFIYHLHFLI